jgi:hypothetical protein
MPYLNWSLAALATVKDKNERAEMARLFDAYFRVAAEETLIGSKLHLDLPLSKRKHRYHFYAKFAPKTGWAVEVELKREHREVQFQSRFQLR